MAEVAKKHQDKLVELKKQVEDGYNANTENVKRFNQFMNFVFKTTLSDNDIATLSDRQMPTIEFNILSAYISRIRGEFAKQQPSIIVRAADGVPLSMLTPDFIEQIQVVEAHLKAVFLDSNNEMLAYKVFTDTTGGGFSYMKVYTDYTNPKSFEQNIYVDRPYNVTMVVPDPMAIKSHRGDGRFIAELYPMTREQCEQRWGKEVTKDMRFSKSLAGISWSFTTDTGEDIVLVCEDFVKVPKRTKIVRLSNGKTVEKKRYEEFLKAWEEEGLLEQPPLIVEERWTVIETICRYIFCETKVLEYIETDFKYLPIVMFDGNGAMIEQGGAFTYMTRPYVYDAMGIQRLKNLAGQSLGNELENTIQHKIIAAVETIPTDYQDAYQNVQNAQTLLYNHYYDPNSPELTLPPPIPLTRTPIPPEIAGTFRMTDEMTQVILGSYDASGSMSRAPLSGLAFARSAVMSGAASMPYIAGYIQGLNRVLDIYIDLMPKYVRTPRTIPIMLPDGKRDYVKINQKGSIYMDFDSDALQVKVDVGVNFAMQQEITLQNIIQLSQSMPSFAEFFGQEGLQTLLDNLDIRGIDGLKQKAVEFEKRKAQQAQAQMQIEQQQAQMQMAMQQRELQSPTEMQIGQMMVEERAKTDAATIAIKEQDSNTKFIEVMAKIGNEEVGNELQRARIDAENTRSAVSALVDLSQHVRENLGGEEDED